MNPRSGFAVVVVALLVGACSSGSKGSSQSPLGACASDPTAQTFTAGMSKTTSGGVTIAIEEADPAPPELGKNAWRVRVTDSSGSPISDATVRLVCRMVHAGAVSHGCAVTPDVLNLGSGEYQIGDLNPDAGVSTIIFNMAGHWDVTIAVARPAPSGDGGTMLPEESVTFSFCM